MARKKISIADALQCLQEQGVKVKIEDVVDQHKIEKAIFNEAPPLPSGVVMSHTKKTAKITLYARHNVGSGGYMHNVDGEQSIESAQFMTYGPGVCTVPIEHVNSLLHADCAAREADKRFLERTPRQYIITQRVSPGGARADVALRLQDGMLDDVLAHGNYAYRIR